MADSTCSIDGCNRSRMARGWCSAHYKRWAKYGDPEASAPRPDPLCAIPGCDSKAVGRGWCGLHYQRWQRHGDPLHIRQPRICEIEGCNARAHSKGWCTKHYTRWSRHGSPVARVAGEVVDGRRICPGCREDKLIADFGGHTGRCKSCLAAQMRVRRLAEVKVPLPVIHCIVCAVEFIPRTLRGYCCSAACSAARKRQVDSYTNKVSPNRDAKREWVRANPLARRNAQHQRRAQMVGSAVYVIARQQIAARMQYFGNRCWMCRGPFEAIDHVKPLSAGGPHILANLRPACTQCNSRKSGRWQGVEDVVRLAA